jgi:hypothetical protein
MLSFLERQVTMSSARTAIYVHKLSWCRKCLTQGKRANRRVIVENTHNVIATVTHLPAAGSKARRFPRGTAQIEAESSLKY